MPNSPRRDAPLVVIDTNVLLALWIFVDPEVEPLRRALDSGSLIPIRSSATDAEIADVLARSGLFTVPADRRAALLREWESSALLVRDVIPATCHCRDPDDQKFVDLAVTARAHWMITRDKALLKLQRKLKGTGLRIVTPGGFLAAGEKDLAASGSDCANSAR